MTDRELREPKRLVETRTEGALAVIELNDPPANTYTYDMMRQLETFRRLMRPGGAFSRRGIKRLGHQMSGSAPTSTP